QLAEIATVDHLVLAAIERDQNTAAAYDVERAKRLVTLKLVGYTEVIHALLPRMTSDAAIVLFGGLAKDRPYPGSTTVSTINGGVIGMVHTLAVELAPIRVNAVHPGIVGDSPFWMDKPLDHFVSRTPTGRLATTEAVADATESLLRNRAVNGIHLTGDGGCLVTCPDTLIPRATVARSRSPSAGPGGWAPRWSPGCAGPARRSSCTTAPANGRGGWPRPPGRR